MTDAERRLIERCYHGYLASPDHVDSSDTEMAEVVLRATGIPLPVLAALADGEWQAVPKEATKEMTAAEPDNASTWPHTFYSAKWRAMLSAAPTSPEGNDA